MQLAQLAPLIQGVMGIGSTASGLYGAYENAQEANKARGLLENPAKFQQFARGYTQPLTAGIQKGVANEAQGYAAERGLAESPAQEQQIIAQAIAPYIQQNQLAGQQEAMSALQGMMSGGGNLPTGQTGAGLDAFTQWLQGMQSRKALNNAQNAPPVPYQSPVDFGGDYSIPFENPNQTVDLTGFSFGA